MMPHGFGPHGVVTPGELAGSLIILALSLTAFAVMAYRTRIHHE
jgi:hypothetical protein